jgi:hypothetical protein
MGWKKGLTPSLIIHLQYHPLGRERHVIWLESGAWMKYISLYLSLYRTIFRGFLGSHMIRFFTVPGPVLKPRPVLNPPPVSCPTGLRTGHQPPKNKIPITAQPGRNFFTGGRYDVFMPNST